MTSSVAAAGSYWVAVCRDAAPIPSSDCSSVHRVHQCETTRAACRWILKSVFACIWNVVCIYNPHAVPQLNKIVSRRRRSRRRLGEVEHWTFIWMQRRQPGKWETIQRTFQILLLFLSDGVETSSLLLLLPSISPHLILVLLLCVCLFQCEIDSAD